MKTRKRTARKSKEPTQNSYGFFGWSEFNQNRRDLLDAYFSSKARNKNRSVRTEHGLAAEAKLRDWLARTLPRKFGVTSGYVIPDLMAQDYQLSHFDVIIYDLLEAPILWIDSTEDHSEGGKKRAIPARYVRAVYEVKATLTPAHAEAAMAKLATLNHFHTYLIAPFHTAVVFFELPKDHSSKNDILSHLVPPVHGFVGGIVLHCTHNADISGVISIMPLLNNLPSNINEDHPIAKDVDSLNIYLNEKGQAVLAESGGEATLLFWNNSWHVSRGYGCAWADSTYYVRLSWSKNKFARWFLDSLARLNGEPLQAEPGQYHRVFGQVFDHLPRRPLLLDDV